MRTHRFFLAKEFVWSDVQLQRSGRELVEGRSQLEAVLEERDPSKDVQPQSGSRHGYHQTPHIPVWREQKKNENWFTQKRIKKVAVIGEEV